MSMKRYIVALSVAAGIGAIQAASAEQFQTVTERDNFVSALSGKQLTRLGIKLDVLPTGEIRGRAFGTPVKGAWRWDGGYFCRDLYYGERDLGPNCQQVKINGDTVRFISDQGDGDFADLKLE